VIRTGALPGKSGNLSAFYLDPLIHRPLAESMNYFKILNISVLKLCPATFANFSFSSESYVLPDTKLGRCDSHTLPLGLHPTPYCEDVSIGHSRRCHACSRVNRVIVSLDKFRQNVNISVRVPERKISVQTISDRPLGTFHDRTFHIGIYANLKLNALIT